MMVYGNMTVAQLREYAAGEGINLAGQHANKIL